MAFTFSSTNLLLKGAYTITITATTALGSSLSGNTWFILTNTACTYSVLSFVASTVFKATGTSLDYPLADPLATLSWTDSEISNTESGCGGYTWEVTNNDGSIVASPFSLPTTSSLSVYSTTYTSEIGNYDFIATAKLTNYPTITVKTSFQVAITDPCIISLQKT